MSEPTELARIVVPVAHNKGVVYLDEAEPVRIFQGHSEPMPLEEAQRVAEGKPGVYVEQIPRSGSGR
jgi:hypothetical protein